MGRLLALRLYQAGWQVTLFDQNKENSDALSCSSAAAGLLTPVSELDHADEMIFHLGLEAITKHWPEILQKLPEPIYWNRIGSLVVHHPQDGAEWLCFSDRIKSKLGNDYFQSLPQDELQELEPELGKFEQAYYFAAEGNLDSQAVLRVLGSYLRNKGVDWYANTEVLSVHAGQVIAENVCQQFDMVFDCRGLGGKEIYPKLRGLRGELIYLHAPDVGFRRPIRLLHPRYKIYLAPRPNHHYLIGATELETEDQSAISVRSTLELLTAAYYVHPGFAEARIVQTITHCRPTLPHHLPCIKYAPQLIAINGLYRHGFLIAPTLAQEVMNWLSTQQRGIRYPQLWESLS
ncbi:thiamine biosynthesis oxidoreductase ThiO [Legionella lansingensis]|uniref:D-amino-acid oxidase n=2 Tax=Legionella lansingensis TaxID=45067 RepID=A0A0W0VMW7_9GAMM|nr:thiamine biosynthesis oxidoreductase ThiO [Legionella lansingensis]SNV51971.1 thiamine biosynthesis oxidoreductase ThiO [Legionella lansingensis]